MSELNEQEPMRQNGFFGGEIVAETEAFEAEQLKRIAQVLRDGDEPRAPMPSEEAEIAALDLPKIRRTLGM